MKTCPVCHEQLEDKVKFCIYCGAHLNDAAAAEAPAAQEPPPVSQPVPSYPQANQQAASQPVQPYPQANQQTVSQSVQPYATPAPQFPLAYAQTAPQPAPQPPKAVSRRFFGSAGNIVGRVIMALLTISVSLSSFLPVIRQRLSVDTWEAKSVTKFYLEIEEALKRTGVSFLGIKYVDLQILIAILKSFILMMFIALAFSLVSAILCGLPNRGGTSLGFMTAAASVSLAAYLGIGVFVLLLASASSSQVQLFWVTPLWMFMALLSLGTIIATGVLHGAYKRQYRALIQEERKAEMMRRPEI